MKYTIQAVAGNIPGVFTWRFDNRKAAEVAAIELCKKHNVTIEICCVVSTAYNEPKLVRHEEPATGSVMVPNVVAEWLGDA